MDVLETVEEFGSASLELVAWEFDLSVDRVQALWQYAVGRQLLSASGENELGEPSYRLADGARVWLSSDPDPARRAVSICLGCGALHAPGDAGCGCEDPRRQVV